MRGASRAGGVHAGGPAAPSRRMGGPEQCCLGAEQSAPAARHPPPCFGREQGEDSCDWHERCLFAQAPQSSAPEQTGDLTTVGGAGHPIPWLSGQFMSPHPVAAEAQMTLTAQTTGSARVCLRTVCAKARILFTDLFAALKMLDSPRLVQSVCLMTASPRSGTGERFLGP